MKCKICGRELKTQDSINRGCGIVCSKKSGIKKEIIKGYFYDK